MASMRKFRYWSVEELKAATVQLEQATVSGARMVNYTGGGTVIQVMREEYVAALKDLYNAIDLREGRKLPVVRRVLSTYAGKGF